MAIALLGARVAHADSLLAQAAWPPPRLTEPMQTPVVVGPRLTLQVDNPNGRLQQYSVLQWRDICLAPCGVAVDGGGTYRIGGGTSIPSEPFQLPRTSGEVHVDAHVASKIKHWVGLGLMIGGAVSALYGIAAWTLFNDISNNAGSADSSQAASDFGRTFGIIFISVGAVLEIVGITMFASSTSVQVR